MSIGIPLDEDVLRAFCERRHIQRMAIFGSALRSDFSPESDIDILVEFQPSHTPGYAFVDMEDELAALLHRRVDLNTSGFLSPYIRDRVEAEAYLVYDATR